MKAKGLVDCTRTETVCDLYAQVIWLRKEVERLERPTLRIPVDRQASRPKQPSIARAVKNAAEGG
jgi:hypothetical protein